MKFQQLFIEARRLEHQIRSRQTEIAFYRGQGATTEEFAKLLQPALEADILQREQIVNALNMVADHFLNEYQIEQDLINDELMQSALRQGMA